MKLIEIKPGELARYIEVAKAAGDRVVVYDGLPMFGVKKLLLPISEVLFQYDPVTGEPEVPPDDYLARPTVIAGVRPCDARAALLLTGELLRETPDPYVAKRAENTTLLVVPCEEPYDEHCFCELVGDSRTAMGEVAPAAKGLRRPEKGLAEAGDNCFSCGICFMVCPTCGCFSVSEGEDGRRVRSWNGCTLTDFTRIAPGRLMEPTPESRMAHRWRRKYEEGARLCVGCGRCERYCPAGNSMKALYEEASHE
ncbi:MAG TPA: 4Fe-4S dicluster domain-containing protein [Terriglobales bacterium]|nr:4Fe-4S dicluster domain-containing protein [Terriglobales bacterium]